MIRKSVETTVLFDILPDKKPIYLILKNFNFSIVECDDEKTVQFIMPKILSRKVITTLKKLDLLLAVSFCITDCPVMDTATGCGGLGYFIFRFSMQQVKFVEKTDCLVFTGPKHLMHKSFTRPNR